MIARNVLRIGVLAGLAGGAAEVAWVAGYGAITGTPVAGVAEGVTTAFLPVMAGQPMAVGQKRI